MKNIGLFLMLVSINTCLTAQDSTHHVINLKMNLLNWVTKYPSLAGEFQLGKKSSLQLRAYGSDIVFISRDRTAAASLSYRKYFGKRPYINGFYAGIGIDNHFDLDNYANNKQFDWQYDYGIGPQFSLGYQITKASKIVLDFGFSYSIYINSNSTGAGLIVGLGYKIRG